MLQIYNYRHLFFYVRQSLLLFLLAFLLNIHIHHIYHLYHTKKALLQSIQKEKELFKNRGFFQAQFLQHENQFRSFLQNDNKEIRNAEIMSALLQSAEPTSIRLVFSTPVRWAHKHHLIQGDFEVTLQGSFEALLSWLIFIMNTDIPIVIQGLTIKAQSLPLLSAHIKAATFFIPSTDSHLREAHHARYAFDTKHINFFNMNVSDVANPFSEIHSSLLQKNSLKHIKWIGYILEKNITWALMKLPNNQVIPITQKSLLGFEKAKVLSLVADRMQLDMQGKRYTLFYGKTA